MRAVGAGSRRMRFVDLFCGCGGLSEGLRQAGWECVCALDDDPFALQLYAANFPGEAAARHDLRRPLPDAPALRKQLARGALVGGPPCQDFALTCANGKGARGERAQLTCAFGEHVASLSPEWVIFENVKYAAHRPQFLALLERLRALGYAAEHRVVSTRALGMTQSRCRLILLAHRERAAVEAAWRNVDAALAGGPRPRTLRETFAEYGAPAPANHVYYPTPCARDVQPSVFSLDDRGERRAVFTVRGRARPMPASYRFRPRDSTADRTDVFALAPAHLAALQGFPREYALHGPAGRLNQALGNAVPPPLARLVAEAVAGVERDDVS